MKKFISGFDLFPASPTLRVNGDSNVVNLCGGIFSIIIFSIFVYVFIINIISTVKLQRISATEVSEMKTPSEEHIGNITIGIGLQFLNLTQLRDIFQLQVNIVDKDLNFVPVSVYPCSRQYWSVFNDAKYKSLNLETFLCVQRQNVQIYGENGAQNYRAIYISLSLCNNLTSPLTCATTEKISNFFNTSMITGRFLACSYVILDTGINPTNQNPIVFNSNQKTLWLLFNQDQSVVVQTFLGIYEIDTDTNFLPFPEQQENLKGYFVAESAVSNLFKKRQQPQFIQIYIFSSSLKRIIKRNYGKFDEVLSYVGGLYGLVISFLGLFLVSFNQYKYELRLGQGAFNYKIKQSLSDELSFSKYIKYIIFDYLNRLFCLDLNWQDCKVIDQARSQAIQQIDGRYLLKRIVHLQKFMSFCNLNFNQKIIFAMEDFSLQHAKQRRLISEYCGKFTSEVAAITIEEFMAKYKDEQISNSVSSNGLFLKENQLTQNEKKPNHEFSQQFDTNFQKGSTEIIDQYLQRYNRKFALSKDPQLSNEDLDIQKDLAAYFYDMSQDQKMLVIKKIPLGILRRFKNTREEKKARVNKILPLFQRQCQVILENRMQEYIQN